MSTMTAIRPEAAVTYPARPINGGEFDPKNLPRYGLWAYQPKYNGWRALVHVPSKTIFNRLGQRLSIEAEFDQALDKLASVYGRQYPFEWLDCEGLDRRHSYSRGTLIILDWVVESMAHRERMGVLEEAFEPHRSVFDTPGDNSVLLVEDFDNPQILWDSVKTANLILGCEYYEGIVAKLKGARYNIQSQSPDQTTATWKKFRWSW